MCLCQCVCVTFVVFTDCDSCTKPISTSPGSMEAGEYGLTRGTCFVAGRLVVVAVAELLWISWCVLDAAGFRGGGFPFFFFERTRPAASMRPPCLITSLLVMRQFFAHRAKQPLQNEAVFSLQGKKASSYRGSYRVPLFSLSVYV